MTLDPSDIAALADLYPGTEPAPETPEPEPLRDEQTKPDHTWPVKVGPGSSLQGGK